MNYLKNTGLVILIMVAFIRCTEIYTPEIDSSSKALIVEGLITDGSGPFSIKLSEGVPFSLDSVKTPRFVSGAKLTIIDNENHTFVLINAGSGNYNVPTTFKAKIGNSYKLHIVTTDGSIYESNSEKLLPPLTYDSIRALYTSKQYLDENNDLKTVNGADIRVDLFSSVSKSDSVPLCRFTSKTTVQYYYNVENPDSTDFHWVHFGWANYSMDENENITEEKSATANPLIKNHSLGFIPFGMSNYGYETPVSTAIIYYVRYNQYTINSDSYNFYKEANNQLAANGKIFDPITSQLYGNMKCLNNSSKIVLGLFEVSSVTQSAIVSSGLGKGNKVTLNKAPYTDIPKYGEEQYKVWDGNPLFKPTKDPNYIFIPLPDWWYHN